MMTAKSYSAGLAAGWPAGQQGRCLSVSLCSQPVVAGHWRSLSDCPVISIQQVCSLVSIFSTQPAAAAAAAMSHVQMDGT